ncbi:MAG: (Na+)-NQR maturation NqrM [Bauldia sp.]|nr:(Na+)-NQR maturation NqrM [Bauldia sp.]MCW5717911.1 (Na+)-NQR maturation NqrM [Bauldia sp.]
MTTFLLALALVTASIGALAVGVLVGRKPISGSCGGLACIPGVECGACTRPHRREGAE